VFRLASWNVNSLNLRLDQVLEWFNDTQLDVLALQETKVSDEQFPIKAFRERGYEVLFSGQKAYNGVAVISRYSLSQPLIDIPGLDGLQRRILAVTVAGIRVINVYVPNGSELNSDKYQYKLHWLEKLSLFLQQQMSIYPRIAVLGDFNVAPEDRDIYDPSEWQDSVLASPAERAAFVKLIQLGLYDSFRNFVQEEQSFSWWDYRAAAFRRNRGLRIDHILLTKDLNQLCQKSLIDKKPRKAQRPSDHAPVWVELDLS
jgi:exodeoxyribonuclease III